MDQYCRALLKYIKDTGITQSELAKRLKVSRPTVSCWFTGQHNIAKKHYSHIIKLIGYNPERSCPLEPACPIWHGDNVNFMTAEVVNLTEQLNRENQHKAVKYLTKLVNKQKNS